MKEHDTKRDRAKPVHSVTGESGDDADAEERARARREALAAEAALRARYPRRFDWIDACTKARRSFKDELPNLKDPSLHEIAHKLALCGSQIGVLACPKCDAVQIGSGDYAVKDGSELCNCAGCPLCDAEDRSLRANTLGPAFQHISHRARGASRKLAAYVKQMERWRDPRKREGRRILADRKAAIARLEMSGCYAFEVARKYDVTASTDVLLKRFRRAAETFSATMVRLWRDQISADSTKLDLVALGTWMEPPSLGRIVLRGAFFGMEITAERLQDLVRTESHHTEVAWLRPILADETAAWSSVLAGGSPELANAATFAEGWQCDKPCFAIPPATALLWSAAVEIAGVQHFSSFGALRDYYRPIHDPTHDPRSLKGHCAECKAVVRFKERITDAEQYLRRCRWLEQRALAPRDLQPEREGHLSDSESEANAKSKRGPRRDDE